MVPGSLESTSAGSNGVIEAQLRQRLSRTGTS